MTTVEDIARRIEKTITDWDGPLPAEGIKFISWSGDVSESAEYHADHVTIREFDWHDGEARLRAEDRQRIVRSLRLTAAINGWSQADDAAAVLQASGLPPASHEVL